MKEKNSTPQRAFFVALIKKLYGLPFLNRWLIFVMDVLASIIATCIVVIPRYYPEYPFASITISYILLISLFVSVAVILVFGTYRGVIRHSTFEEVTRVVWAMLSKSVFLYGITAFLNITNLHYLVLIVLSDWVLSSFLLISIRAFMVNIYHRVIRPHAKTKLTWVYGDTARSANLVNYLATGMLPPYMPTLVLTRKNSAGLRLNGVSIAKIDDEASIEKLVANHGIPNVVLFPDSAAIQEEKEQLIKYCIDNEIELMVAPEYESFSDPNKAGRRIREIRIEDLLGRPVINVPMDEVSQALDGKVVLVTGAAGSIGSEMVRQLCKMNIRQLVMFDNAETPLHNIRLEIEKAYPEMDVLPIIGDVRSERRLRYLFERTHPQYVFHAAAYKHVPLMEENPCEAVLVNVKGTSLLAQMAIEYGVEKFVMVSTDKAVNPTNVMGSTKRVAEIIVQNMDIEIKKGNIKGQTKFITTRFGNVLGSNGSVIPLFRSQIAKGGPVTVTDPNIIRYFMTIPEACTLVLEAGVMGDGGEIFAFHMGEPMKIDDLARKMIKLSGFKPGVDIEIVYTGLRPGEKLYEEVLDDKETTLPTAHPKIQVAKFREIDKDLIRTQVAAMVEHAHDIDLMGTVAAIKGLVPEYKSKNSPYEVLDKA